MLSGVWDFELGLNIDGLNDITFDAGEKFESRLYFFKNIDKNVMIIECQKIQKKK